MHFTHTYIKQNVYYSDGAERRQASFHLCFSASVTPARAPAVDLPLRWCHFLLCGVHRKFKAWLFMSEKKLWLTFFLFLGGGPYFMSLPVEKQNRGATVGFLSDFALGRAHVHWGWTAPSKKKQPKNPKNKQKKIPTFLPNLDEISFGSILTYGAASVCWSWINEGDGGRHTRPAWCQRFSWSKVSKHTEQLPVVAVKHGFSESWTHIFPALCSSWENTLFLSTNIHPATAKTLCRLQHPALQSQDLDF